MVLDFKNVVGVEDYHEGKSESIISGLKKVDDYTYRDTYILSASMLQAGGGVTSYVEPKYILEKTPPRILKIANKFGLIQSASVLSKAKSITPGESKLSGTQ